MMYGLDKLDYFEGLKLYLGIIEIKFGLKDLYSLDQVV